MQETSGPRHLNAFAWWDVSTSCLRTWQRYWPEMEDGRLTLAPFSETLPRWGSVTSDGEFIAHPMPVLPTCGDDSGFWPTPTPTPRNENEPLDEWLQRREREKALGRNGNGFGMPLDVAVRFIPSQKPGHIPTPTAADVYTGKMKSSQQSEGSMHSVSLPDYVAQRWATPNARDYKDTGKNTDYHKLAKKSKLGGQAVIQDQNTEASLNPDWVERYLMSLPEGWTMLEPLPDGAYDQWLQGMKDGTWWAVDPGDIPEADGGIPRTVEGAVDRKERLTMLGNGIVPASAALAIKDMSTW